MWKDDSDNSGVYLHSVITVVDADRIYNEFLGEMEQQQQQEKEEEEKRKRKRSLISLIWLWIR